MRISDPANVTRLGLQNAASIASLILTTDSMTVEAPKHGSLAQEELPRGD
jgi:chaperonin GroEL (HSP60 family)